MTCSRSARMLYMAKSASAPTLAPLLTHAQVEVFLQLAETALSHTWSGRLGLTFDLMPHAGQLKDGPQRGLYYAYGYAGHGMSVASYLGHEMGQVMAGTAAETALTGLRQRRYFFTKYDSIYLPLISSWFRLLDRIQ